MRKLHKYVEKLQRLVMTPRSKSENEYCNKLEDVIFQYLLQIESRSCTFSCPVELCVLVIQSMNTLRAAKQSQKCLPKMVEIKKEYLTSSAVPFYTTNNEFGRLFKRCTRLKNNFEVSNDNAAEFTIGELFKCVKTLMQDRKEVNKLTFAEFINAIQVLAPLLLHIENTHNIYHAENTFSSWLNQSVHVAPSEKCNNMIHSRRIDAYTSEHHEIFTSCLQLQEEYSAIETTHVKWQPWVTAEIQEKIVHQLNLIEQDTSKVKNHNDAIRDWEHFIRTCIPSYYVARRRVEEYLLTQIITMAITNTQRQRKQFAIDLLRIIKHQDDVCEDAMINEIIEWNASHTAVRQRRVNSIPSSLYQQCENEQTLLYDLRNCNSSSSSSCSSTSSDDNEINEISNAQTTSIKRNVVNYESNNRSCPNLLKNTNNESNHNNQAINKCSNLSRDFHYSVHCSDLEKVKGQIALANSRYSLFSDHREYFYMALELLVYCVPTFYVDEQCVEEVYLDACNNYLSDKQTQYVKVISEYFPVVECLLDLPELRFAIERNYSFSEREETFPANNKAQNIEVHNSAIHNKEDASYENAWREHTCELTVQRKTSSADHERVYNSNSVSWRIRLHDCFAHHKKGAANALYKSSGQTCELVNDDVNNDNNAVAEKNNYNEVTDHELPKSVNENAYTPMPLPICNSELIHHSNSTKHIDPLSHETLWPVQTSSSTTEKHCNHVREEERLISINRLNNEKELRKGLKDSLTLSPLTMPTNTRRLTSEIQQSKFKSEHVEHEIANESKESVHSAYMEDKEEPALEFDVMHALESDARKSCKYGAARTEEMQSQWSSETKIAPKFIGYDEKKVCDEKKSKCLTVASNVPETDLNEYNEEKSSNTLLQEQESLEILKNAKIEADELFTVLTSVDNVNEPWNVHKNKSLDENDTEVEMLTADAASSINMTSASTTKSTLNSNANSDVVEENATNTQHCNNDNNTYLGTADNSNNKTNIFTEDSSNTAFKQNQKENTSKVDENCSNGLAIEEQMHKNEEDNNISALRNLVEALLLQASRGKNKPLSTTSSSSSIINEHANNEAISEIKRAASSAVNMRSSSSPLPWSSTSIPSVQNKITANAANYSSSSLPRSSAWASETANSANKEEFMLEQLAQEKVEKDSLANANVFSEEALPYERQKTGSAFHHDVDAAVSDDNNPQITDEPTEGSLFGIRGSNSSNNYSNNTEQSMSRLRKPLSSSFFSSSLPSSASAFNTRSKMWNKEKHAERKWESKSKSANTCPWLANIKQNNATQSRRSFNVNDDKGNLGK